VQGVRATTTDDREAKHHPVYGLSHKEQPAGAEALAGDQPFSVQCSGSVSERSQVESLFKALTEAKQKSGEAISGNLASFASFVRTKTSEIRNQYGCESVVYSVEVLDGQVKLKAKAKV
jgi:hypothetical protein